MQVFFCKKYYSLVKEKLHLVAACFSNYNKCRLAKKMRKKHELTLKKICNKNKLKIVFLVFQKSVWKVDAVFKRMQQDPYFEPEILVCPYIQYGDERMYEDMEKAYLFFKNKGYPVTKSQKADRKWVKLEEIKPDMVFFTNPHNLTMPEYYEEAYLNYLSCYVPYFFLTTTCEDDQSIYNDYFHNAMWKIFMPHQFSMDRASNVSSIKGVNTLMTGYPACEGLVDEEKTTVNVWKKQLKKKKKIIFAPHHTIFEDAFQLSNFLTVAEIMVELAIEHKEVVQWSFKPHPILKSKLYLHPLWGNQKTDMYYDFWKNKEYTQLDEGEYTDLFLGSDSIIHDCGSFIAEYLFVEKPCAYLEFNGESQLKSINNFGKYALEAYEKIRCKDDLVGFVAAVAKGSSAVNSCHKDFVKHYIQQFYKMNRPSTKILNHLIKSIKKEVN